MQVHQVQSRPARIWAGRSDLNGLVEARRRVVVVETDAVDETADAVVIGQSEMAGDQTEVQWSKPMPN
jgi:hypothetical protein